MIQSRYEKKLLAASLLLLPATMAAHKLLGFRRLRRSLERLVPVSTCAGQSHEERLQLAQSIARTVQLASDRGLFHPSCLQQSLYLHWLLARKGLTANLRIGVRKRDDRLEAHAWVEYLGRILNDSADVTIRYAPMDDAGGTSPAGDI